MFRLGRMNWTWKEVTAASKDSEFLEANLVKNLRISDLNSTQYFLYGFKALGFAWKDHETMKDAIFQAITDQLSNPSNIPKGSEQAIWRIIYRFGGSGLRWNSLPKSVQDSLLNGINRDRPTFIPKEVGNIMFGYVINGFYFCVFVFPFILFFSLGELEVKWAQLPHLAQRNLEKSWLSWSKAPNEHTLVYFLHGSSLMEYKWNENQKMKESILKGLESCLQKKDRQPADIFVTRAMASLGEVGLSWNELSTEVRSQFIHEVDAATKLPSSALANMIFG
jgi:hypothetical protein